MEVEKGKTIKYIKEKRQVAQEVKDNLKKFTRIKKAILNALKEKPLTVPELAKALDMPADETLFYLMSLLKYGYVVVDGIDDMDEYFYYKPKSNE
jgi:predicted Rossmann fold nucleotide-binding protein DprA/Smf involved in DNA uptake